MTITIIIYIVVGIVFAALFMGIGMMIQAWRHPYDTHVLWLNDIAKLKAEAKRQGKIVRINYKTTHQTIQKKLAKLKR